MSKLQYWANKIGAKYQELTKLYNEMESELKPKIPQTEEIYTCHEFDTHTLLFMFAYEWWDERSFAIACNQEDRANRACFTSEVTHGWLIKTYSDEPDEPEEQFEFFSTEQEEGHPVTYFEL
jgi:hypothetical protein